MSRLTIVLFCFCLLADLHGYPAGRGGEHGGMAAARGGGMREGGINNISRTPSMSRVQSWSQVSPQRTAPNFNRAQMQNFIQRHPSSEHIDLRSQQDLQNLRNRFEQRSGTQVSDVRTELHNKVKNRNQAGDNLRAEFASEHPSAQWFKGNFWQQHRYSPAYRHNGDNWWKWNSWNNLNSWLAWGAAYPVYYEGGYPIDISTDEDPADWSENYEIPQMTQEDADFDWQPLGVFAVTNDENIQSMPIMYFQLAIAKDGSISGAYFNQATDQVYQVEGMADPSTQRIAWKIANTEAPIFQTGLYNLTLPQTSVEVYFSDENVQDWLMIRL